MSIQNEPPSAPSLQPVTLHAETSLLSLDADRRALAQELHPDGTVGAPDGGGMLEVELEAPSREQALAAVRAALAAAGVDQKFSLPAGSGDDQQSSRGAQRAAAGLQPRRRGVERTARGTVRRRRG